MKNIKHPLLVSRGLDYSAEHRGLVFSMGKEIWKSIVGWEDFYEVSNFGDVRSIDRIVNCCYNSKQLVKGRILSQRPNQNGYLMVSLYRNHQRTVKYAHRLVAEAFIENPQCLPQVNHRDEIKTNNHVDNLEWCDGYYNMNYGTVRKRLSDCHKDMGRKVYQINKHTNEIIAIHANSARAMELTGIDASAINKCCLNRPKFKTAGGYKWEYAD